MNTFDFESPLVKIDPPEVDIVVFRLEIRSEVRWNYLLEKDGFI